MGRVSKSGVHRIEKSIGCRTLELQKLLPVGFLGSAQHASIRSSVCPLSVI